MRVNTLVAALLFGATGVAHAYSFLNGYDEARSVEQAVQRIKDQPDKHVMIYFGKPKNCPQCNYTRNILNGGALAGGAKRVTAVESSAAALAVAKENLAANSLDPSIIAFEQADVFGYQRLLLDRGQSFDLVVLDPPKFAPTAVQAKNAARAYKDINLMALKLLAPGGLLATFSCSGGVSAELFQSIVAGAANDAGVDAKIIERFGAAADHPVALNFPEGDYLKGLLVLRP